MRADEFLDRAILSEPASEQGDAGRSAAAPPTNEGGAAGDRTSRARRCPSVLPMAAPLAASERNAPQAEFEELAVRYTLGEDPTKLLLRVPWKHGAISQDSIVEFLTADGAPRPSPHARPLVFVLRDWRQLYASIRCAHVPFCLAVYVVIYTYLSGGWRARDGLRRLHQPVCASYRPAKGTAALYSRSRQQFEHSACGCVVPLIPPPYPLLTATLASRRSPSYRPAKGTAALYGRGHSACGCVVPLTPPPYPFLSATPFPRFQSSPTLCIFPPVLRRACPPPRTHSQAAATAPLLPPFTHSPYIDHITNAQPRHFSTVRV
jgi:hypothetical protein